MGKLNKKVLIYGLALVLLVVLVGGTYLYLKSNPPLEIGTLVSDKEQPSVIVVIGNRGLSDIQIMDVAVNNHEDPTETKIQMSNAMQGFTIPEDFEGPLADEFDFVDISEAIIQTGTSPAENLEKQNDGTATEEDEVYGISVRHDEEIHTVHIKYSYFGISLFEEVEMPF